MNYQFEIPATEENVELRLIQMGVSPKHNALDTETVLRVTHFLYHGGCLAVRDIGEDRVEVAILRSKGA